MRNSSVLIDHLISMLKALNMFQLTDWVCETKQNKTKKTLECVVCDIGLCTATERKKVVSQRVVRFHS